MDAFAENQMRRDDANASPQPVRRSRTRNSKEYMAGDVLDREQEPKDKPAGIGAPTFEVPGVSVEESALIAARWTRKQSTFMPVGDPYAEPDTTQPYASQFVRYYCTAFQLVKALRRLFIYLFPVLQWLPSMNSDKLKADVIAGITVGVMLIPQSMSYADIAGLQYRYGLYTSVVPIITYALMGSSRQLGVGPVAMISLLVEVGLQGALTQSECPAYYEQFNGSLADLPDQLDIEPQYVLCPDEYARLAFITSLLVGLFQLGAGFLRLVCTCARTLPPPQP